MPGGVDLVPGALVRWPAAPGSPPGLVVRSSRQTGNGRISSQAILGRNSNAVVAVTEGCQADLRCAEEDLADWP